MLASALDLIRQRFGVNDTAASPVTLRMSRHCELLELWRDAGYTVGAEIGVETGRYS